MQAVVRHRYGSPDVLEMEDVPKPTPGDGEVLIRVRAASVNAADWRLLRADPFLFNRARECWSTARPAAWERLPCRSRRRLALT